MSSNPTWGHLIISRLATFYLYVVGWTSFQYELNHSQALHLRRNKKPYVYGFWHRYQVYLAFAHRGEPIHVIVSQSKDGEYIAQVMKCLGSVPVRGSTSRGGQQALRDLISKLEAGNPIGFTPDGPRGPVQTVHGGIVASAQLGDAPIIPLCGYSRRAIIFKSWDRFVLPLPFGVNTVVRGQPIVIPREMPEDIAKEKVRQSLNSVSEMAENFDQQIPGYVFLWFGQWLYRIYVVLSVLMLPLTLVALVVKFGWGRSIEGLRERLVLDKITLADTEKKRLWFHVASVGEWQALKPILQEFLFDSNYSCVITTTTPEAKALVKRDHPDISVSLLPLDLPWLQKKLIRQINPDAVCIVETELWPTFIEALFKKSIPIYVLNGRFSAKSYQRWAFAKPFISHCARRLTYVYARSESDADRYRKVGVYQAHVQVFGNSKSDNLKVFSSEEKQHIRTKFWGEMTSPVLIAGSTWPGEEDAMLKVLSMAHDKNWRLVLAPRRPERWAEVKHLLSSYSSISWSCWSDVKKTSKWTTQVLLVDTLGDLSQLYAASDLCFVGGSIFPRGGQNPLEPAAAGLPLIFGPFMQNFEEEAKILLQEQAALQVDKMDASLKSLIELMNNPDRRKEMSYKAQEVVSRLRGASPRMARDIKEKFNNG